MFDPKNVLIHHYMQKNVISENSFAIRLKWTSLSGILGIDKRHETPCPWISISGTTESHLSLVYLIISHISTSV